MAAGSDKTFSNQGNLENGLCKESEKGSAIDKDVPDESDDPAQAKMAKPPLMRHCISHTTLADPFSLVRGKFSSFARERGKCDLEYYCCICVSVLVLF